MKWLLKRCSFHEALIISNSLIDNPELEILSTKEANL